jgi:hypothetical protein
MSREYKRTAYDLIGHTFVCLTIKSIEYKGKRPFAKCVCTCGEECVKRVDEIKRGKYITCSAKCTRIHNDTLMFGSDNHAFKGSGKIYGTFLCSIRASAKRRDIEFDTSIDTKYLWSLFLRQKKKCKLTGLELSFGSHFRDSIGRTASLDRIDSNKGYVKGNLQWVHKQINMLKTNIDQESFIKMCKLVAEHNK